MSMISVFEFFTTPRPDPPPQNKACLQVALAHSSAPSAMTLHIQMPTPRQRDSDGAALRTPAGSPPSRPSSRSERLLRDTLRKADERRPSSARRKHSGDDAAEERLPEHPPLLRTQTAPSSPMPPSQEALLRSRLENALSRVSSAPQQQHDESPRSTHARSHSLADEWPWSPSDPQPLTPPPTPPPATPPSPFNARAASQICRQLPGYVSFQDVEGLGEPPSAADAEEDDGAAAQRDDRDKKWWNWPWGGRAQSR